MNTNQCTGLINTVVNQISTEFASVSLGEDCLIVTPFLNSDLAPVEIYVKRVGEGFYLSDEGEALNHLFVSGLIIEENRDLKNEVKIIARANNIQFKNSELYTEVSSEQVGDAVRRLATAIQGVSYLIYKRTHRQRVRFEDEVEKLLITHRVVYESKFRVRGYASNHTIPFYINSTRNVLLEPLSAASIPSARRKAELLAYQWVDLRRQHQSRYEYTVVVDDRSEKNAGIWENDEVIGPLKAYSSSVLFWNSQQTSLLRLVGANENT